MFRVAYCLLSEKIVVRLAVLLMQLNSFSKPIGFKPLG